MRIFLSYASEDRAAAEPLALLLRGEGHTVFFDRDDLPPGGSYDARIRAAIRASDLLVFLVSPDSVAAGAYTLTELGIARRRWPHPAGRVLPVLLRPTPIETIPVYLRAVTLVEPEGNLAADVADAIDDAARRRRRKRALTVAVTIVALAAIAAAIALWQQARTRRDVVVTPQSIDRWKRGQSWESDRYVVRLDVWNGFDVPVDVNEIAAESQSSTHRLVTTYEVSGAAFLTAPPKKRTPWSIVLRWTRDGGPAPAAVHDGDVPAGARWRICWSARERRNCSEWQAWSPRGAFEPAATMEIPAALRKQLRSAVWTGRRFILGVADGRLLAVAPSLDFARAQVRQLRATATVMDAAEGRVAIGLRSPDEARLVDEETLQDVWTAGVPTGQNLSSEPASIAYDGETAWLVTKEDSGAVAFYHFEGSSLGRQQPLDEFDLRGIRLVDAPGAIYGVSSSTPHYIYRFPYTPPGTAIDTSKFEEPKLITYSGHDIDVVGCIDLFAPAEQSGSFYALACSFELIRFHFEGSRFVVEERLNGPAGYDPAVWEDRMLSVSGRTIVAGMTRYSPDYKPVESHVLLRDDQGVWRNLLTIPEMRVETLATNGAVTIAIFSDGHGTYDSFALRPPPAAP